MNSYHQVSTPLQDMISFASGFLTSKDILICKGISGMRFALPLGMFSGVPIMVKRREGENCHSGHSWQWVDYTHAGEHYAPMLLGKRLVFVDDMIASGDTLNSCVDNLPHTNTWAAILYGPKYNADFQDNINYHLTDLRENYPVFTEVCFPCRQKTYKLK